MKLLSRVEELILLTIIKLEDNAYGVTIRDSLNLETGTEWSFGSIYTPLNKLTRKQFVLKSYGDPSPERGGRLSLDHLNFNDLFPIHKSGPGKSCRVSAI